MINKKREIYIRLHRIQEIVHLLKEIKQNEDELKNLFRTYDELNYEENKMFDNWNNYLEDIVQKLDHVSL